jgi:Tol biopolymer transport system component
MRTPRLATVAVVGAMLSLSNAASAVRSAARDQPLVFEVFHCSGVRCQEQWSAIFVSDPRGRHIRRLTAKADFRAPSWAPRHDRIAYERLDGVWIMDARGHRRRHIAKPSGTSAKPRWSPDGSKLVYGTGDAIAIVDLRSRTQRLLKPPLEWVDHLSGVDWSPDGKEIAFSGEAHLGDSDFALYLIHPDGSGFRQLLSIEGVDLAEPRWSPSGRRILFIWHRNRSTWLYLMNADGRRMRRLISISPDDEANWASDGRRVVHGHIRLLDLQTRTSRRLPMEICRREFCTDADW